MNAAPLSEDEREARNWIRTEIADSFITHL